MIRSGFLARLDEGPDRGARNQARESFGTSSLPVTGERVNKEDRFARGDLEPAPTSLPRDAEGRRENASAKPERICYEIIVPSHDHGERKPRQMEIRAQRAARALAGVSVRVWFKGGRPVIHGAISSWRIQASTR